MITLFLDLDGVICLSNNWGGRFKKKGFDSNPNTPLDIRTDDFDSKAVKVLNNIVEVTGCEIVISSDWTRLGTLEQMKEMFITRGIKPPIDYTPDLEEFDNELYTELKCLLDFEKIRVLEINKYLDDHPEITRWVAVDDMDLSELGNFVQTKRPHSEGIKQCGIYDKLLGFLN